LPTERMRVVLRQREQRTAGQADTENIVIIVLVSLTLVIGVGLYGRQIFTAFSCAAQSIAEGRISFTCPSSAKDGDEEAEPVEAGATGPGRVAAEPGGGSSAGGGSGGAADQKLKEAKELLKSTKSGREVLKFLDDSGVKVELRGGDGSFFSAKDNKIVINDAKTADQIALTAAHEVNHALFDKEGRGADIDKDSRADFVRKSIEEEAIGTVASIQLKKELQAAGKTVTATYPLEKQFNAASEKAVDELKKSKPTATAAELDAAGKAAGLDAVVNGFKTGKVVTSTTKETYPEFYGQQFDAKHAPKAPEPGAAGAKDAPAVKLEGLVDKPVPTRASSSALPDRRARRDRQGARRRSTTSSSRRRSMPRLRRSCRRPRRASRFRAPSSPSEGRRSR
jgi:Zn-dependent peptidase ImmA (M78 family)